MTTTLQKQRRCVHWYVFESPHGATVRGICRKCGKGRRLPSATAYNPGYGYGNRKQKEAASKKGKRP